MANVYTNGKIISGYNIPEVAIDCIREFTRKTDYKGDIILPVGPYNQSEYYHVVQSLYLLIDSEEEKNGGLLKMFGGIREIMRIDIKFSKKDALSLKLRSGESHIVLGEMLNWDSNLKKVAKSYKRKNILNK